MNSCSVSHILAITNTLVLLTLLFPDKRKLEEYSHLPIHLAGKGVEVHFG